MQSSPFIPASGGRHGKQTETHPKQNIWPGATLQLPPPGSAWHASHVRAKGCGAARQPARGSGLGRAGDGEGDVDGRGWGGGRDPPTLQLSLSSLRWGGGLGWQKEPFTGEVGGTGSILRVAVVEVKEN